MTHHPTKIYRHCTIGRKEGFGEVHHHSLRKDGPIRQVIYISLRGDWYEVPTEIPEYREILGQPSDALVVQRLLGREMHTPWWWPTRWWGK